MQIQNNMDTGQIISDLGGGVTLPMVKDQWMEVRCDINLASNKVSVFYGGNLLSAGAWVGGLGGPGLNQIQALDLYANNAGPTYYDNISLTQPPPTITCPGSITTTICSSTVVVNFANPTVANGTLAGCTPPSGSVFSLGTTPVTCTATNDYATNTCTFNVTVQQSVSVLTVQPPSQSVPAGSSATLTAVSECSTPLSYLWQFNGTNILGATDATLTISNVYSANGGTYAVAATFLAGTNSVVLTATAQISPIFPPNLVATLDPTGILTVLGTDLDDDIEIHLKAGDTNILEIDDVKHGLGPDFTFAVASIRKLFLDVAAGNGRVVCNDTNGLVANGRFAGEFQLGDGNDTFIGSTAIVNMAALTNMMALNQVVSNLYAGAEILSAYAQSNLVEPGSNVMADVLSEVLDPAAVLLDEVQNTLLLDTNNTLGTENMLTYHYGLNGYIPPRQLL